MQESKYESDATEYDQTEDVREELIASPNESLIKKTLTQLKRMKLNTLSKVQQGYLASQTDSVRDLVCKTAIKATSKRIENYQLVDFVEEMSKTSSTTT